MKPFIYLTGFPMLIEWSFFWWALRYNETFSIPIFVIALGFTFAFLYVIYEIKFNKKQ